ncbi:hypothetical protein H2248_010706 [Termitomyces sp. 'cryptogamus']|nr:hypothetical protein H2248_010706 [Termitomyces sp. 'cryptogamus']
MNSRTGRQLVVKCSLDSRNKKITFDSARNCTYELLRQKVEQCYSLSSTSFAITYKDDDGEITTIASDTDLAEAIQYFHVGDDVPLSSATSILSGRSFGSRKVTLKVQITVDYDGPSLSDTSSLISLDEYRGRNTSQQSFSLGPPSVDDDSVTVSSRDNSGPSISSWSAPPSNQTPTGHGTGSLASSSDSHFTLVSHPSGSRVREESDTFENGMRRSRNPFSGKCTVSSNERIPEDPSAVFERLKLEEQLAEGTSSIHSNSLARNSRGAAWLKEQNERHLYTVLGVLPETSMSDDVSFDPQQMDDENGLSGDLALERDPRGRYYYNYTSAGSTVSQVHDSGYDDGLSSGAVPIPQRTRPSSMHLNWLANQQIQTQKARIPKVSLTERNLQPSPGYSPSILGNSDFIIDRELLQYLPPTVPPEDRLTDCSNCGTLLDFIRYVCSTCGEKHPVLSDPTLEGKGKPNGSPLFIYPPQPLHSTISSSPGNSSSSLTYLGGSSESLPAYKPLTSIPSTANLAVPRVPSLRGFELCSNCLESAGVHHAIEAASSASPIMPISASADAQAASQWIRAPPKKGELRHAFFEKYWSHNRWEEVEQDEGQVSKCSTCQAITFHKRYKCVSCPNINLCRACYSQVHELHPLHAFLNVPDRPSWLRSDSGFHPSPPDPQDEEPLKHPGVKCTHCLQDIVGARFHCAICDFVDICANCESAGLPGNLDSADGGHNSSHILIKIPYPLEMQELESASRRAINLWTGGDAASVGLSVSWPKAGSVVSSYARTIVGNVSRHAPTHDHRLLCSNCGLAIIGIRYQCANCPSSPRAYNLCENCEQRSYIVHDPMHIFFKLPRPVHKPIEDLFPMVPILYQMPVGPQSPFMDTTEPAAYLNNLKHASSLCDRCIKVIVGAWFRCAYCARDLCDTCEAVDTHNDTHVFLVFKSLVDVKILRLVLNLSNPWIIANTSAGD